MSEIHSDHLHSIMTVLSQPTKDTAQMKRVFELSALLLQPEHKDFASEFAQFPFHEIEPRILLSLLCTPLNPEIVAKASIDWTQAVSIPAAKMHGAHDEAFRANHQHKLSLAGLFLLDLYLEIHLPKSENHADHKNHSMRCQTFQEQCLNFLETQQSIGNVNIHWEPLSANPLPIKEVALALYSPHLKRWLNDFSWENHTDFETTLLSMVSSELHFQEKRARTTYGQEKPDINTWLHIFNTILERAESSINSVDLLRSFSLPHSQNTQLTVAQIIFKLLETERSFSHSERVIRAKNHPQHKVQESDLGPEIENPGKQILKNIFATSLQKLSFEQQKSVVKDVLHTITENPRGFYQNLRPHCEFLMEASPASLRETVKHEMLQTKARCSLQRVEGPRKGFYLFNGSPIYQGILTVDESKGILEKEVRSSGSGQKEIWPLVMLIHMSQPHLHHGIANIIKCIQSSGNKPLNHLNVELATLIARVDMKAQDAPKRKM